MWKEGLFIMPQHLQLMDEYHERLLDSRVSALVPNGWGLSELVVDPEELARGVFSLSRCVAVLPDGMLVDVSGGLSTMASRALRPGGRALEVFLAVPSASVGGVTGEGDEHPGARFRHNVEVR